MAPPVFSTRQLSDGIAGVYRVNPEEVQELANETNRIASKLDNEFKKAEVSPTDLVGFEVGDELAQSHRMAHSVVMGTFSGVRTDLTGFSAALLLAVKDAEAADELSQAQLAQIGDITYSGYNADSSREQAQRENLTVNGLGEVVLRDDTPSA